MKRVVRLILTNIIVLLFTVSFLYSENIITINAQYSTVTIPFPYTKPAGVNMLYGDGRQALVIDKIITETGKKLSGHYYYIWFGSDEGYDKAFIPSTCAELDDVLSTQWDIISQRDQLEISYSSLYRLHPIVYKIRSPIREVTFLYHVQFPDGTKTEPFTITYTLDWQTEIEKQVSHLSISCSKIDSSGKNIVEKQLLSVDLSELNTEKKLERYVSSSFESMSEEQIEEIVDLLPSIHKQLARIMTISEETYIPIFESSHSIWVTIHVW